MEFIIRFITRIRLTEVVERLIKAPEVFINLVLNVYQD